MEHNLDLPSWHGEPQDDMTALQMVNGCLAAIERAIGRTQPDTSVAVKAVSTASEQPRKLLTGWLDIAAALDMKYADCDKIKSLNKRFEGPIGNSGKGTSPMVYRDVLIQWWNRLAIQEEELANQRGRVPGSPRKPNTPTARAARRPRKSTAK